MIATIIIGLFSIFISYLSRFRNFKYGLEVTFFILTCFLSIRYEWGSDYPNYLSTFYRVNGDGFSIFDDNSNYGSSELGWTLLNILFYPFGFFGLVIFLTCIENYLIYITIKKYVDKKLYWLAVFIYVFTSSFMLTGCSMMRQFLVMVILLYSIKYLFEHKTIRFIVLILFSMAIHTTAIVIIPFFFFAIILSNFSGKKFFFLFLSSVLLVFLFFKMFVVEYAEYLLLLGDEKYEKYLGDESEGINSGMGLFFNLFMTIYLIYKIRNFEKYHRTVVCLYSFYILFYPLYTIIPLTVRLGYYFSFLSVVVLPFIINNVKVNAVLFLLIAFFIFYTIVSFLNFFSSPIWFNSMYEYKTIFSAPYWL